MDERRTLKNILNVVRSQPGSVLSFEDRGPWGDKNWRGNNSGYIHAWLIDKYNVKSLGELYAGSGTGSDICKDMGVSYIGLDLNPNPVRPDIRVCNILTDDVPEEFCEVDMVYQHMAYPEIGIKYAGSEYPDPTKELAKYDIGQMSFAAGMEANNAATMKLYRAMHPGAKMAILCGNIRRKNDKGVSVYHDMMLSLALPGEVIQNVVKMQHNCVSDRRVYSKSNFVPILHENLVILQKPFEPSLYVACVVPRKYNLDIRDSITATWRDVIYAAGLYLGGEFHYKKIVDCIKTGKKAQGNNNIEAKVRQVLRMYPKMFQPIGDGVYKAVAA